MTPQLARPEPVRRHTRSRPPVALFAPQARGPHRTLGRRRARASQTMPPLSATMTTASDTYALERASSRPRMSVAWTPYARGLMRNAPGGCVLTGEDSYTGPRCVRDPTCPRWRSPAECSLDETSATGPPPPANSAVERGNSTVQPGIYTVSPCPFLGVHIRVAPCRQLRSSIYVERSSTWHAGRGRISGRASRGSFSAQCWSSPSLSRRTELSPKRRPIRGWRTPSSSTRAPPAPPLPTWR